MADIIELPITRTEYNPNLAYLRKIISLDRSDRISPVKVLNGVEQSLLMFVRHSDLYAVGIDWGEGPYHFNDMQPFDGSRPIGFKCNYDSMNFDGKQPLMISDSAFSHSIAHLSKHRAGRNGANILGQEKVALVRLLFAVPESLRNWHLQREVAKVLERPGTELDISGYRGNGLALNSWADWSAEPNWPERGIILPHVPKPVSPFDGGKRSKR